MIAKTRRVHGEYNGVDCHSCTPSNSARLFYFGDIMPLFLTAFIGKAKYYLLGALGLALGLFALIVYERRIGGNKVREGERRKTLDAVQDKQKYETGLRNSGLTLSERRERVRKQRDELRKLLQPK